MEKKYILIGAYPGKERLHEFHGGGQLTATTLLVEYAEKNGIILDIIDTTRNVFPPPTLKSKLVESKNRIQELLKLLQKKEFEGVILFSASGFSFYEKIFMAFLIKRKKIKVLFFIRSGHFMELTKKSFLIKKLHKFLLNIPSYVGAQGNKWIDFYIQMGVKEAKIKLFPNWIKINKSSNYVTGNQKVTFLYAGWMVEKKGVLDLFDVIENNSDLKSYTFQFAGGGTLLEELKLKKEEKKLENIELLGWVDSKEIFKYYDNCDVFILPSHAEGFPNVILEALNHGLPIITTNVGGISDSVIDNYNGLLFEAKDKKKLYENIILLALSQQKREAFSKNGRNILKKRHEFNKNCELIFELFKETH